MREELEQELKKKYPKIFSNLDEITCGDGWFVLLDILCNRIQSKIDNRLKGIQYDTEFNEKFDAGEFDQLAHKQPRRKIKEPIPQVVAAQIKEKFGTLRFYCEGVQEPEISGMIDIVEIISGHTCELCGNPGKLRTDRSWIRTLCDDHAVQHSAKN